MRINLAVATITIGVLLLAAGVSDARRQMKGGKPSSRLSADSEPHRRSKRTIGDIINWKLGLLQNIFDGITGFFGGGNGGSSGSPSSSYGAPSNSYGVPGNNAAPSYKAPRNDNHFIFHGRFCLQVFLEAEVLYNYAVTVLSVSSAN